MVRCLSTAQSKETVSGAPTNTRLTTVISVDKIEFGQHSSLGVVRYMRAILFYCSFVKDLSFILTIITAATITTTRN